LPVYPDSGGEEAGPFGVHTSPAGKRWYDEQPETAKTVEIIRSSPPQFKNQVGAVLLALLSNAMPE